MEVLLVIISMQGSERESLFLTDARSVQRAKTGG